MTEPNFPALKDRVSAEEWAARVDLAAAYRLVALSGWDDLVYTHISARVPGESDAFLINPYGLFFEEITASSLVKVNHRGEPLQEAPWPINPAGFVIHSALHEARPEVQCVLHTHTPHGMAVSAQRDGLRPLSQTAGLVCLSVAYHDYEGLAVRDDEKARLARDIGTSNFLILRNHGLLTCGRSVGEAFQNMYFLEKACRAQLLAQSGGVPLVEIGADVLSEMQAQARVATRGQGADLVWPGLLRRLRRQLPGFDV